MKRIAYTLSFVAATAMAAAPIAAQSGNGPWWDPGRTQTRSGQQNGSVNGRDGNVYNQQQADGVWRADSRDRNGNTIYVRTRYDSDGQLVREYATRNIIGRYNVIDRQVVNERNSRYGTYGNRRGKYDTRGTDRNRRNDDGDDDDEYSGRGNRDNNDRWDQNGGHDNGRHNGRYKDKGSKRNKRGRDN